MDVKKLWHRLLMRPPPDVGRIPSTLYPGQASTPVFPNATPSRLGIFRPIAVNTVTYHEFIYQGSCCGGIFAEPPSATVASGSASQGLILDPLAKPSGVRFNRCSPDKLGGLLSGAERALLRQGTTLPQ